MYISAKHSFYLLVGCLASAVCLATNQHGPETKGTTTGRNAGSEASSAMPISVCPIGLERYLPGDHYFCEGSNAYAHGHYSTAISLYESAAAWGDKRAQFNMGLIYLYGAHSEVNKSLGLAWLALAAERPNDQEKRNVLVAFYTSATTEQRKRADALWNKMKDKYGDKIALARAIKRYDRESAHIRRAAQRDPFVVQYIAGLSYGNITNTLQGLDDRATREFGRNGEVTVGNLTVVDDTEPAPNAENKKPQTPSNP